MEKVVINAKKRGCGKKEVNAVRNAGMVPGIYYMNNQPSCPIAVDPKSLAPLIYTGETKFVALNIEGEAEKNCYLQDITFDPVTEAPVHFDLIGLNEGKKMKFVVPLRITGSSIGVKMGGVMQVNMHKLPICCLPKDAVPFLEINIEKMNLGDIVQAKQLATDTVAIMLPPTTTLVQITKPRAGN